MTWTMPLTRGRSLIPGLCVLACAQMSGAQPSNPVPSPSHEATVLITATGAGQEPVVVRAEDLTLTEDGVPQHISRLQQVNDSAIIIAIIIDISMSQERTLDAQKVAAKAFVNSILRPDRDLAAVATLTDTLYVEQQPTNNLDLVRAAIDRAKVAAPPGYQGSTVVIAPQSQKTPPAPGTSAIWDAVKTTCQASRFSPSVSRRRGIILLTDGQDTASKTTLTEAAECAGRKDITIYSIGIGDSRYDGVNKSDLRKLSAETGGSAYFPKQPTDLSAEFDEIGKLLRNYYILNYSSASGKQLRKVRITLRNSNSRSVQLLYGRFVAQ